MERGLRLEEVGRLRRRIFPDEEGTESRGRARRTARDRRRRIFPDEEGTESVLDDERLSGRRRRRIFPDEEGTERPRPWAQPPRGATSQNLPR